MPISRCSKFGRFETREEKHDMAKDEIVPDEELPQSMKRRGVLGMTGLGLAGGMLGLGIPLQMTSTRALAQGGALDGKDGLDVLNDRPVNAETPAHLLDDAITPNHRHFIRNNGLMPMETAAEDWVLTVDGLVDNPMEMSIADLRENFEVVTMALTLECGGNGRAYFNPPASGNQ